MRMLKYKTIIFVILAGLLCNLFLGIASVQSATTSSITQRGITWYFDKSYEYGTFANGDYWVVGPVTITRITPDYADGENGWEVNPLLTDGKQGFTSHSTQTLFSEVLIPALPYTTHQGVIESIVKTVYAPITDSGNYSSYIKSAAVLTVLTNAPANNGATVFRPPFTGTSKPLYNTGDVKLDLIPSRYQSVSDAPSLSTMISQFSSFRLDFHSRDLRPTDCMYDYTPQNTPVTNNAMLRLMLNDRDTNPSSEWSQALYKFTQYSIDTAHAVYQGFRKVTGHSPGYPVIAAWAATLLEGQGDMTAIKNYLQTVKNFDDYSYTVSTDRNGRTLWGQNNTETAYWNYIMGLGGNRSNKDPYGYIDGGKCGVEYQLINSQPYKGEVLIALLMPGLQNALNSDSFGLLQNYVKRWVSAGIVAQLDPCAPYTTSGVYGVNYGPDPANPGMCILDPNLMYYKSSSDFQCKDGLQCGRYPTKHQTMIDEGLYRSNFVAAMWNQQASTLATIAPPKGLMVIP